jgi:hypothetical protein
VTATAEDLRAGLWALVSLARETDAAKLKRYERQVMAVAQRAWERVWPSARDELLTATTVEEMETALDRVAPKMRDYVTDEDADDVATTLVNAYTLGHEAGAETVKRVGETGNPAELLEDKLGPEVYTVRDKAAIEWLERDTLYWVGNAWDEGLGKQISGAALRAFDAERPETVAKNLATSMASYNKPDHYWDVVSNAAVVRGQTMGTVSGLNRAGAKSYRFQALIDQRTSDVCRDMNGKVFTVEQANAHVDRVVASDSPEAHKEAWPWVQASAIKGQSTADLAAAGIMMPPLHGNCRSVILVEEFMSLSVESRTTKEVADRPLADAILSLFHHIHHEDGEHEVHHCGGKHPGVDYTIEHCSCGLHRIDQQEAVGHGTKMDLDLLEITVTFEDECPDGGWHIEAGVVSRSRGHHLLGGVASRVYR